jgi:4-hydroxy-2-oxoheptanedioate aldolase
MQTNHTKARLAEGKVVFGAIVHGFSPETAEMLGHLGFDFAFIDCEHGPMSLEQVEHMVRACEVVGITPIARVPDPSDSTILRFLDRGVQGLMIPHVNTRAEAEAVAKAARYYPEGHRGSAGGRAHDHNVNIGRAESMAWLNKNVMVIPMCEEVEALNNLDEIVQVPGIDVIHVAAGDLSQSMGFPPQEEVRKAISDAMKKIRAAGKNAGAGGNSPTEPDAIAAQIRAGANFITIPAISLLKMGAETYLKNVKSAIGES